MERCRGGRKRRVPNRRGTLLFPARCGEARASAPEFASNEMFLEGNRELLRRRGRRQGKLQGRVVFPGAQGRRAPHPRLYRLLARCADSAVRRRGAAHRAYCRAPVGMTRKLQEWNGWRDWRARRIACHADDVDGVIRRRRRNSAGATANPSIRDVPGLLCLPVRECVPFQRGVASPSMIAWTIRFSIRWPTALACLCVSFARI